MNLESYISEKYPKLVEEYKRVTTPFYYEPNVHYNPITAGFGCGSDGSTKKLEIINADYLISGEKHIMLRNVNAHDERYCTSSSEIHLKLKRVDETIPPFGLEIPNSKKVIYVNAKGTTFKVWQSYTRDYYTKKLQFRILVNDINAEKINGRLPYMEFYSGNLNDVYSFDTIQREISKFHRGISVREFKKIVFGDSNIKIKL